MKLNAAPASLATPEPPIPLSVQPSKTPSRFVDSRYGLSFHVSVDQLRAPDLYSGKTWYQWNVGGGLWGAHTLAKNHRWQWRWNLEVEGGHRRALQKSYGAFQASMGMHYLLGKDVYFGLGARSGIYLSFLETGSRSLGLGFQAAPFLSLSWKSLELAVQLGGHSFPDSASVVTGLFRVRFGASRVKPGQKKFPLPPVKEPPKIQYEPNPFRNQDDFLLTPDRQKNLDEELKPYADSLRPMSVEFLPGQLEKDRKVPQEKAETHLCAIGGRRPEGGILRDLTGTLNAVPIILEDCPVVRIPKSDSEWNRSAVGIKKRSEIDLPVLAQAGAEPLWVDDGEHWSILYRNIEFTENLQEPGVEPQTLNLNPIGGPQYRNWFYRRKKIPEGKFQYPGEARAYYFYKDGDLAVNGFLLSQAESVIAGVRESEDLFGLQVVRRLYVPNMHSKNAGIDPRDLSRVNIHDEALAAWGDVALKCAGAHESHHLMDFRYGFSQHPEFKQWFDDLDRQGDKLIFVFVNERALFDNVSGGHAQDNEYEFFASLVNTLRQEDGALEDRLRETSSTVRHGYERSLWVLQKAIASRLPNAPILARIDRVLRISYGIHSL